MISRILKRINHGIFGSLLISCFVFMPLQAWAGDITIRLEKKIERPSGAVPQASGDSQEEFRSFDDLEDPFADETKEAPELKDPYERYNRFMYRVNDRLSQYVLDPFTKGYKVTVPEKGRLALRNVFLNLAAPVRLFSSVFQKDTEKSKKVLSRFVINTTLGVGGMLDVAQDRYDLKPVQADFGQTLGSYGMKPGPYIVMPFFGPSTGRDAVGRVVDGFLNPVNYVLPGAATFGISAGDNVNQYSFYEKDKKALDESTVDAYESVKDFYNQHREKQIKK